MQEGVCELAGGLLVEGFEVDVLRDWEPEELLKDRGDVVTGASVAEQAEFRMSWSLRTLDDEP